MAVVALDDVELSPLDPFAYSTLGVTASPLA